MTNTQENVIWITGASSGIGKSLAFEWARLGYKVVLSSRRKELLDKVADEIRHSGGEALVIPCDIMEETAIENAVQQIIKTWGRLDVVDVMFGYVFCRFLCGASPPPPVFSFFVVVCVVGIYEALREGLLLVI